MNYIIFFVFSALIAYLVTPTVMRFADVVGAIDTPKDERRMHKKPIPLLGGLSIAIGFMATLLLWLIMYWLELTTQTLNEKTFIGFVFGILIILVVGIVDDIKDLSPKIRLGLQTLAALVIALSENKIEFISNPFSSTGIIFVPPILSIIVTIIWIVGLTNAVNFIDGLDGLAAGVSLVSAISLLIISLLRADYLTVALLAAFIGAIVGFLPRNFYPAKVFMGSSGSYFLGFVLAVISTSGSVKAYTAISLVLPILILGLPIFDTLFAIVRRLLSGKSIAESDRGHIHHRLIDAGFTHIQSVLFLISVSILLGLASILLTNKKALPSIIVFIFTLISIISLVIYITNREKIITSLKKKFRKKEKDIDEEN